MRSININGKEYPCRTTMGAMLRFRNETGRDASAMRDGDTADLITFLHCCVASACNADGVEFNLSLTDFADRLDPETVADFYKDTGKEAGAPDAKADPPTS